MRYKLLIITRDIIMRSTASSIAEYETSSQADNACLELLKSQCPAYDKGQLRIDVIKLY